MRFARHRYLSLAVATVGGGFAWLGTSKKTKVEPRPIILFTDLDGTWVDSKFSSEQTRCDLEAFHEYWDKVERPIGSILCYNTARCIRAYEDLPKDYPTFQAPDALITGEGTEIRWVSTQQKIDAGERKRTHGHKANVSFSLDAEWANEIRRHWWESGLRAAVISALDELDDHCIPNLNDPCNALNDDGEARHAITIKGGEDAEKRTREIVHRLEEKFNKENKKVIEFSSYPAWGDDPKPQLVNAVPAVASKGRAAIFLANKLGFDESDCLGAGDTMGDAPMVTHTNMPFLAVGNAKESLKGLVKERNGPYAIVVNGFGVAGVLEGLKRFRKERGETIV